MKPVRLQLSRRKGFDLQALSRATNGLPAVNVARPGRRGNPHKVGVSLCSNGDGTYRRMTAADAVAAFRRDLPFWLEHKMVPPLAELRGKNVACFCALDQPCHGDVWLEFANAEPPR